MRNISTDAENSAIVRGVISLANSLGLWVVAEGVTFLAQLDFLLAVGCTAAQGFLLAVPVTAQQFIERY